jgi:hypothetical protein
MSEGIYRNHNGRQIDRTLVHLDHVCANDYIRVVTRESGRGPNTALHKYVIASAEALPISIQLAFPRNHVLSSQACNQFFTMHGTTMVFLVGMPFPFGFANYNTYDLVEFLHDVLKVREFPWLLSSIRPHAARAALRSGA